MKCAKKIFRTICNSQAVVRLIKFDLIAVYFALLEYTQWCIKEYSIKRAVHVDVMMMMAMMATATTTTMHTHSHAIRL